MILFPTKYKSLVFHTFSKPVLLNKSRLNQQISSCSTSANKVYRGYSVNRMLMVRGKMSFCDHMLFVIRRCTKLLGVKLKGINLGEHELVLPDNITDFDLNNITMTGEFSRRH